jgi:hypothetical protein
MNQIQNKNNIQITQEDLREIYGKDWTFFQKKIVTNCYCTKCKGLYDTTIIDYKVFLTEINDILLKGKCKTCGNSVNRYLETGEVDAYEDVLEAVRKNYKKN